MAKDKFVVPTKAGWAVKSSGKVESNHRTQGTAIKKATTEAKRVGGEVTILGENGKIREKNTYGKKDPYPPKG